MEAVTSILARGIRVGVLLQGEKVKDDNKTLLQSGISLDEKLDGLGFALEPGHTQISLPPICKEDTHRSNEDDFQVVYRYELLAMVTQIFLRLKMLMDLPAQFYLCA